MIQRIQTVFLSLVVLSMIVMAFFPIWVEASDQKTVVIDIFSIKVQDVEANTASETFSFILLSAVMTIGLAIYSIFQFKNRLNQMKIGALNSLVMVLGTGLSIYLVTKSEEIIAETSGQYAIGFYCFIGAMFFNLLANRFIRKDEQLVKSVDRIR